MCWPVAPRSGPVGRRLPMWCGGPTRRPAFIRCSDTLRGLLRDA